MKPVAPPLQVSLVRSPAPRWVEEIHLTLSAGATVAHALRASGWFAEAQLPELLTGVWGRKAGLDQLLRERDRVEIYRPLRVDPKVARRERFRKQGVRNAGLFAARRHSENGDST
ncbi:MAG: RnfH family protein [Burkholderiales bacterium]|jgi:putative ubiquitin-RnfH superfamily antitoxin RatB of RatAB toxin-antitoxin module|nr:RnfH family protein [Burkholderiales bacterium]